MLMVCMKCGLLNIFRNNANLMVAYEEVELGEDLYVLKLTHHQDQRSSL